MALSKRTLSGCLEPTLASGFVLFLLVQAAVISSKLPRNAMSETRRDIRPRLRILKLIRLFVIERVSGLLDLQKRRFCGRLQQPLYILCWIAIAEHGVACHKNFRARPDHVGHRIERHPAIYFDAVIQPALAAKVRKAPHFVQRTGDELLTAKARVHRHDEHIVYDIEHLGEHIHRSGWIDHNACQAIMALDQVQGAVQMTACLLMNRDPIGPRFRKSRNEFVGILDHQMAIERQLRNLAQRFDDRRPYGEIRDEMAVHDVDVYDTGSALASGAHLFAKTGKVRRKNRGCQLNQIVSLSLESNTRERFYKNPIKEAASKNSNTMAAAARRDLTDGARPHKRRWQSFR